MKKGILTISIDTEMAWGTFDHDGHRTFKTAYLKYRPIVDRLLELFQRYEISATWATVGHLFLDRCDGQHADLPRPTYSWYAKDWFSEDPGTDHIKDPIWYGKDIPQKSHPFAPKRELCAARTRHIIMPAINLKTIFFEQIQITHHIAWKNKAL